MQPESPEHAEKEQLGSESEGDAMSMQGHPRSPEHNYWGAETTGGGHAGGHAGEHEERQLGKDLSPSNSIVV